MFYVGQKVVCVDDGHYHASYPFEKPVKGRVYTVSRVYEADDDGEVMLCLDELDQPGNHEWYQGDHSYAYRPVVERKTSIEIFKAMLTPKTEQVSA